MNLIFDIEDEPLYPSPSDDVLNALFADGFCGVAFSRIQADETTSRPSGELPA